jgi:hypothetical protein
MHRKLLLIFKDSIILEVHPREQENIATESLSPINESDMELVIDFLKTWQNGLNRRFMVKEIQNKFRFGVGFTFLDDPKFKNQSLLFVLLR